MVVRGTCLWTCLWIGILRSKNLQAQFKVETVAFLPWTKLWVTVTPVEMSPVAMSHSSFDVYWSFWYMSGLFFVCLDLSSVSFHMKIPLINIPRWWSLRSAPRGVWRTWRFWGLMGAEDVGGWWPRARDQHVVARLHLDFEECQRTSDITISAHVRIIKYLSTAKAVFYMFYLWFKDLGLYCWLRFLFKNQLVQWMVHQPVAYETRWMIVLFHIKPPVVLTGCTINSRLSRNIYIYIWTKRVRCTSNFKQEISGNHGMTQVHDGSWHSTTTIMAWKGCIVPSKYKVLWYGVSSSHVEFLMWKWNTSYLPKTRDPITLC